jgi:soluble lytic murein transglycosylase-like protein
MKTALKLGLAMGVCGLCSTWASAAELALLRNGGVIRCERREQQEGVIRLFLAGVPGAYVDVTTQEVVGFEADDAPPTEPESAPSIPTKKPPAKLDDVVAAAGRRNHVDVDLIMAVIRAESGFQPNAVSQRGAQGLMQLMPRTASAMGVKNALEAEANVEGGTRYLRSLLDRYGNSLSKALAAYNAGPQRVDHYGGVVPYAETRRYVARIMEDFYAQKRYAQAKNRKNTPATASTADKSGS